MNAVGDVTVLPLPRRVPETLALGAFLKNTVSITRGAEAQLSPPVGNLETAEAIRAFEDTAAAMMRSLSARPRVVAHDLHPDFPSTRHAQALGLATLAVQHHHAHIAALCVEHGVEGPVLGLALDGFGLGPGNESWGGELLWVDGPDYRRLGHLARLAQPGGDVAAREPWRMAAAALHHMGRGDEIAARFPGQRAARLLGQVLAKGVNSPPTSSCGRLFDAACGLLGVHPVAEFEGQAPMALEKMVASPRVLEGGWRLSADGVLDTLPLLEHLLDMPPDRGADLFHGTLVAALAEWAVWGAERSGADTVAMGGGCFFNRVLTRGLTEALEARGLRCLTARRVSPGDPAVSLGQAWVAALAVEREMI